MAEQLPVSHKCAYSNYCYEYEYYDQWESGGGNLFTFYDPVMYDDPCDVKGFEYEMECDWTGAPFQNHKWQLGVVELLASKPVQFLDLGAIENKEVKEILQGIGCAKEENCYTQYSWLQSSILGTYENDHLAIGEGYWDKCIDWIVTEEAPCPGRRIWGFEGDQ